MYISKTDANAISRAIFEIQQTTEAYIRAETPEEKIQAIVDRRTAELVLKEFGINTDFFEDSEKVRDKGGRKWLDLHWKIKSAA